jgi:hypothetical protein
MKFINRKEELTFLEKKYKSKNAELIILYGRRRIGKTELLSKFCEDKRAMYFLGRLESREDTIKRFNNLFIEAFKDNKLLSNPLQNFDNIFDYLPERSTKRATLIIDEFPFIIERFPEMISILQDKWDSKLKNSQIMIILCGSSISMMEKYAINYQSPLYGRRTGQWKLEKLRVFYLLDFFPNYSPKEIIELYSCLDSIPGYLVKFSKDKSLEKNIKEKVLSKGEFLYEEIEVLLREEFRDPSNYMSILSVVSGGLTTFNDIHNRTHLDKSLLSKYLYVLENLGIVEKKIPITESYKSKLKSKGAIYSVKDNFFSFWFRFVYLKKQELEKGNLAVFDRKEFNDYVSLKFEKFIMELIPYLNIIKSGHFGSWWHKDKEIDVVGLNEHKEILFAECKWQDKVDAEKVLVELKEKSRYVDWNNEKRKEKYAVFAKSFSKKVRQKDVYLFDLKDIEKALKKLSIQKA